MSLFNNVAASQSIGGILKNGVMGSISSGISSGVGGIASSAAQAMGGSKLATTVAGIGSSMATNAAMGLVNKYIPAKAQQALHLGSKALGDVMNGDFSGAGLRLLDSGILDGLLKGASGAVSQARYWGAPTPLFGGVSPTEARSIVEEMQGNKFSKKSLFLIEISSPLADDFSQRFNMFVTEIDYAPLTISGEKRRVGAASVDSVQSAEPVEMRITTLDDKAGSIKTWFEEHFSAAAAEDGTIGVPASYAIKIKVVHSFITKSITPAGAYSNIGLFRPANLEINLSRREHELQEVQMTFMQLDTFMAA